MAPKEARGQETCSLYPPLREKVIMGRTSIGNEAARASLERPLLQTAVFRFFSCQLVSVFLFVGLQRLVPPST
jgi:hypothetical protein